VYCAAERKRDIVGKKEKKRKQSRQRRSIREQKQKGLPPFPSTCDSSKPKKDICTYDTIFEEEERKRGKTKPKQ
jgi:hypothetical protein